MCTELKYAFQQYSFPSSHSSIDKLTNRYDNERVKRLSSDSEGTTRSHTSSSSIRSYIPLPPSRSASFKKNWKPRLTAADGIRPRAGSLTPGRSARRHPVHSYESSNVEMTKFRELTRKPSSNFSGTTESSCLRTGDDKVQGWKASEDASIQHDTPACSKVPKYELDEDDKGHVRSGTLPALIERLTRDLPTDLTSKAVIISHHLKPLNPYCREVRKQNFLQNFPDDVPHLYDG